MPQRWWMQDMITSPLVHAMPCGVAECESKSGIDSDCKAYTIS